VFRSPPAGGIPGILLLPAKVLLFFATLALAGKKRAPRNLKMTPLLTIFQLLSVENGICLLGRSPRTLLCAFCDLRRHFALQRLHLAFAPGLSNKVQTGHRQVAYFRGYHYTPPRTRGEGVAKPDR